MSQNIIEIDEINYSFILTIKEIQTLEKIANNTDQSNFIVFNENDLENIEVLRKKGFVSLTNKKLIISSVIDFIITQALNANAKLYPNKSFITCENCVIEIENYEYQKDAMKITLRRK